jgi:predicted kinase
MKNQIFIIIIGGAGSGKNFIYNKHFSHLPLFDVDEYIEKYNLSITDALKKSEEDLFNILKNGNSAVSIGTGSKIDGILKKLKYAQSLHIKTYLFLVDTNVEKAQERNIKRAQNSKRLEIPYYKIQKTNQKAKENFEVFKNFAYLSSKIKN